MLDQRALDGSRFDRRSGVIADRGFLTFDGTCREAMTFYQACLGGSLDVRPFDASMPDLPPGAEQRTMHARLESGPVVLMASDTMPGTPLT
ncbi:MAG: hypothetical protein EOP35_00385, partial [Rubrivivax sp.]